MEKYEQLRQLGKGSYGSVFLVREKKTLQHWVMKRIALRGLGSKERQGAYQEAKLLRELHHPHICSYHDSFTNRTTNQLWRATVPCERRNTGGGASEVVLLEVVPLPRDLTSQQRGVVERKWAGPAEELAEFR